MVHFIRVSHVFPQFWSSYSDWIINVYIPGYMISTIFVFAKEVSCRIPHTAGRWVSLATLYWSRIVWRLEACRGPSLLTYIRTGAFGIVSRQFWNPSVLYGQNVVYKVVL
jgi:hypothetical protein